MAGGRQWDFCCVAGGVVMTFKGGRHKFKAADEDEDEKEAEEEEETLPLTVLVRFLLLD